MAAVCQAHICVCRSAPTDAKGVIPTDDSGSLTKRCRHPSSEPVMNLGLLEPLVRVHIHVPKALCVRFYDRAGTNPLLSIYAAAFAIKDCIKTLYGHLFYYACL